jgi:hypothetical protein
MFCYKCGSKIPDNAHFCPFCGETLDEIVSTPKESSLSDASVSESGLVLSLGAGSGVIVATQYIRKEITVFIENLSSSPVYHIELQLSAPARSFIPPESKKFSVIKSNATKRVAFNILPKELGNFTINATLLYGSGDSLVLPINLQVKATNVPYQEALRTTPKSSTAGSFVAIAIVAGIIALMLVGFGIPTAFSSPSVGITMIVIGIIIFSIATQGKCFLCFLGCDGCDGCDCDC